MARLLFDTYGKTGVRLTYVDRSRERHELKELSVKILFQGDFEATYLSGDNRQVLPTDTMKNTVYALARQLKWTSIESFARGLAEHFLGEVAHLGTVEIEIEQTPWDLIENQATAFVQNGVFRRTTRLAATRSGLRFVSGIRNLQILKTANSGFAGYIKDRYTTLPETEDRLFGTVLDAAWAYAQSDLDFDDAYHSLRATLLEMFARHQSLSVQQTLFAMANEVLAKFDSIQEVHLTMPNKHCLLVNLAPFGLDNPNRIFVPTDEPSGYIEARVGR
jgi:urate oxidase